jgi:hypothetical protein
MANYYQLQGMKCQWSVTHLRPNYKLFTIMDRDSNNEDCYPPEPKKPKLSEPAVPVVDQAASTPMD